MFEDLDSLSRQLKIKKNVLVRLKEISGPKFSNFSNIKSQELFWDAVDDNLSFSESNELHKMELEFATSSNSFDSSFLNASFQDLFLYNCKLNERVPSIIDFPQKQEENESGKKEDAEEGGEDEKEEDEEPITISEDDITEYLENSKQWTSNDEKWICNKQEFTVENLLKMCIAFIKGGHTWEYCAVLSQTYNEALEFMEARDEGEDFSNVLKKMTEVKYITNADLKNDVEKVTGKKSGISLSQLRVPRALTDSLRKLMQEMKKRNSENIQNQEEEEEEEEEEKKENVEPEKKEEEPKAEVELKEPSHWYEDRLQTLLDIAAAPIPEKKQFELTPSIINSRVGAISPSFEQGSIAEMLFMSDTGCAATMPYNSTVAEIPSMPKPTFVQDATRKFVAQNLIEHNYNSTSITAIEVLTDIIVRELKEISLDSAKYNHSKKKPLTPKESVKKALRDHKYDIKGFADK